MSDPTFKPIDVDAEVRRLEGNRRNLGRELGKYQGGRAHHVLELQLLYDGSGGTKVLRQDPVARLLFYAQKNGLFDINGLQNTLILPDNNGLASALGTSVHDGGPHVKSYNDAIRTRVADLLKQELETIGVSSTFDTYLQTGQISGQTASEITEMNARIATQLDRVATEFNRSLGGRRPPGGNARETMADGKMTQDARPELVFIAPQESSAMPFQATRLNPMETGKGCRGRGPEQQAPDHR